MDIREEEEGGRREGIREGSLYKEEKKRILNDTTNYYNILQKGPRDNDLLRIGTALVDGHLPQWMIEQTLESLALFHNPPLSESELETKVKTIIDRLEKKERHLTEEVREFYLLQKGYILTTNLLQLLHITTKDDKRHVTVIQNRLEKEGFIEKHGEVRGCYRPVEKKTEKMEFIEDEIKEFPVKFPFGLHDLCKLYPKNIVILAGSKGAGKTAMLLNTALKNQDMYPVIYLNSEMGDEEWSDRLKLLGCKTKGDIRFDAIPCSSQYQDQIGPGKAIYIVDFLEIHDNFFEVAKPIRQIHEKLKDGICIIALQKDPEARLGRGKDFSMEKSRLYLTLDYTSERRCSILTIVDAKAPKSLYSIRGYHKHIKIIAGSRMESLDKEWLL